MRRTYYLYVPIFTLFSASVLYFFKFTAEDAYITYRYAENLVNVGALTFNEGEPINALTSPLHALWSSALFYITGHTVLANKVVGLFFLIGSAFLAWRRFKGVPELQMLVLSLVLLPSSVVLWSVGGLETPLLLFLATYLVLMVDRESDSRFSLQLLCLVTVIAGLGFLARYDSALFFAPIVIHVLTRGRSPGHVIMALAAGALLPSLWLAISASYYGDLLPTSYFEKTPYLGVYSSFRNGMYIGVYLCMCGLIPAAILALALRRTERGALRTLSQDAMARWWLYTGVLCQILYGLTMATKHMMFSFRYFVPFIPAAALVVAGILRSASPATGDGSSYSRRGTAMFHGVLLCLFLFYGFQIAYTYNSSINVFGEYRKTGVKEYGAFIDTLRKQSEATEAHWEDSGADGSRLPRVHTFAAGVLPYGFRNSYVYSSLLSYRHGDNKVDDVELKRSADYIHILAPRHGAAGQQLPLPLENYSLVSHYVLGFDGHDENLLVYYNPDPEPHKLSARIGESR
jgi:hypothetical protein